MEHKIAIVGFGGMAEWHFDEIKTIDGLEIAGIWDIKEKGICVREGPACV